MKGKAHSLLRLTTANDEQFPISMYIEMDVNFLGLKMLHVGFLITKDPNCILDDKHQTKLSRIISWNLIRLAFNAFGQNMEY